MTLIYPFWTTLAPSTTIEIVFNIIEVTFFLTTILMNEFTSTVTDDQNVDETHANNRKNV